MNLLTLILVAIGVSMDAFSVAICKGLTMPRASIWRSVVVGLWFGGFQALMPIVGYFAGVGFSSHIEHIDHWTAFVLLALIGANMIRESVGEKAPEVGRCECDEEQLGARQMLPMAIATSIDALAVGVGFAVLNVNIWSAAAIIGVTTFVLSMAGVQIGAIFGNHYKSKAEFAGGVILILIGLKILLEHTLFA